MNHRITITSLAALAATTVAGLVQAAPGSQSPGAPQSTAVVRGVAVRISQDNDGPVIRFENGREFRLLPLSETVKQAIAARAARLDAAKTAAMPFAVAAAASLPDSIDHRAFYGPIRDQGERGTCVSFATSAAVEGMYRRLDPDRFKDLELSEQWANHLQKMVVLAASKYSELDVPDTSDVTEDEPGSWGGSSGPYLLRVLQRYGLPTAETVRYNPSAAYEINRTFTQRSGGDWVLKKGIPQRAVDDFNLARETLVQTALQTAPFRPVDIVDLHLTPSKVADPTLIEQVIALGHDVAFGLVVAIDPSLQGSLLSDQIPLDGNDAWSPPAHPKVVGGHEMLIVGYNHTKQYFIVRNSWGSIDTSAKDAGYVRMSYAYFKKYADEAAYVQSVADTAAEAPVERLYLGRWQVTSGESRGTLDIYRLPGFFQARELLGSADDRLGTFFDTKGAAYRVNGGVQDGKLVFFINPADANADYDQLGGIQFVAELSADQQSLTGTATDSGQSVAFQATK